MRHLQRQAGAQGAGGVGEGSHDAGAVLVLGGQGAVRGLVERKGAVGQAQQNKVLRQRGAARGKRAAVVVPAGMGGTGARGGWAGRAK